MKKLKTFLVLLTCAALSFTMTGCGSDEDLGPANEIVDASGITLSLEWSTGGTVTQSKTDIDLDLYVIKGTTELKSESSFGFESLELGSIYQDGEYEVRILYYEVAKGGTYSIFATSKTNPDKVVKNTGTIVTTQEDPEAKNLILRITKKSNTYTIVQVN